MNDKLTEEKVNKEKDNKELLKHQQKMLGMLCGLLAPLALLFGYFGDNPDEWWYSISASYYCNTKILMIGLLFTTFVYFMSYRGYNDDMRDRIIATVSGLSALGVIAFPTNTSFVNDNEMVGLLHLPVTTSHTIHCVSAAFLFVSFAIMILFQFTQSSANPTPEKKKRNLLYKICGLIIIFFMAFQMVTVAFDDVFPNWWTMVNEAVMLTSFAVAWLCKAEWITALNDK